MNREIKFRAWSKNEMHYFTLQAVLSPEYWTNSYDTDIFMQFTGLRDKNRNGKEIYEGDIVRFEYDPNEFENYKISWGTATFYAESLEDNEYSNSLWDMPRENMEVIGNVYENPELLNNNLTKTQ